MSFRNGKYTYLYIYAIAYDYVFFVLNDLCVEQETET